MRRVAVSFSQARSGTRAGMYATLTPLRFPGGRIHTVRRGRKWGMQKVKDHNGEEMLYILNFYLPRFLDLPFREKLDTVVHELWHIGPKFDGDLRALRQPLFRPRPVKKTIRPPGLAHGRPVARTIAARIGVRISAIEFPRTRCTIRPASSAANSPPRKCSGWIESGHLKEPRFLECDFPHFTCQKRATHRKWIISGRSTCLNIGACDQT